MLRTNHLGDLGIGVKSERERNKPLFSISFIMEVRQVARSAANFVINDVRENWIYGVPILGFVRGYQDFKATEQPDKLFLSLSLHAVYPYICAGCALVGEQHGSLLRRRAVVSWSRR